MTEHGWAVIGAGPAGIAAVGRLLDSGVADHDIAWIDPEFGVGDLGGKWRSVPSNTRVRLFLDYLQHSPAFGFTDAPAFELTRLDPAQTCRLGLIADPLLWVTQRLRARVADHQRLVTELTLHDRRWTAHTAAGPIVARNVILAVGSSPARLAHPGLTEIPVETALDPEKLAGLELDGATVAVFGSSHSTMIALPNLLKLPVARVVNFYRSPLRYAIEFEHWTMFDDTGLKGWAARWARENVDGRWPDRLERYSVADPVFTERLRECDRVVYTVGFQPRPLPATPQWGPLTYDPANGIIAPGLFGVGIAFPEYRVDPTGHGEYSVGLAKFMHRLDAVLPLWLNYPA